MSWNKCPRGSWARSVSGVFALAALVSLLTFPEETTAQEVAFLRGQLNYLSGNSPRRTGNRGKTCTNGSRLWSLSSKLTK